jgi:hypothetical protein
MENNQTQTPVNTRRFTRRTPPGAAITRKTLTLRLDDDLRARLRAHAVRCATTENDLIIATLDGALPPAPEKA